MKLSELLTIIFKNGPHITNDIVDYCISGENLKKYKEELLKCDEFKYVFDIEFVNYPAIERNNKSLLMPSVAVSEGLELKGNIILYSIQLTPEMYDRESCQLTNIINEISISPTFYNPENLKPIKSIIINLNPENHKDESLLDKLDERKRLHDLLDTALDNPKDYEIKGQRNIILRGIFSTNTVKGNINQKVIL